MNILQLIERKKGLRFIVGWPDYVVDIESQKVFSIKGYTPHVVKVQVRPNGQHMVNLCRNGTRLTVSINRLCYAAQKGISVKDIPAGLVVKRDKDGSYRLLDNRDNLEEASQKNLQLRREQRMEHMERKRRELVILTNYYCGSQTDDNELLSYCEMVRPELVAWCRKRYLLSRANGDDLYSQAVARFLESVSRPSATMTCITGNLKLFIKKVYASHKAETDISRNVMRVLRSGEEGL